MRCFDETRVVDINVLRNDDGRRRGVATMKDFIIDSGELMEGTRRLGMMEDDERDGKI